MNCGTERNSTRKGYTLPACSLSSTHRQELACAYGALIGIYLLCISLLRSTQVSDIGPSLSSCSCFMFTWIFRTMVICLSS